jgi:methyl-accepting chemotaxis protein
VASFRDRFFTPQTARAITSPSAILLAGAGASVAILGGLPLAAAAAVGAAAYGVRVALGIPRAQTDKIDINQLRNPWRQFVVEALVAQRRYDKAVRGAAAGPLRDRLTEIGQRISTGAQECWRIARRGQDLEDALRALEDPRDVRARLQEAQRTGADERLLQALQSQIDSTERIVSVARDTRDRLRLLDARLDEAVARAVELSLRATDVGEIGALGSDVDALVGDMEALRQALDETSSTRAGASG